MTGKWYTAILAGYAWDSRSRRLSRAKRWDHSDLRANDGSPASAIFGMRVIFEATTMQWMKCGFSALSFWLHFDRQHFPQCCTRKTSSNLRGTM